MAAELRKRSITIVVVACRAGGAADTVAVAILVTCHDISCRVAAKSDTISAFGPKPRWPPTHMNSRGDSSVDLPWISPALDPSYAERGISPVMMCLESPSSGTQ